MARGLLRTVPLINSVKSLRPWASRSSSVRWGRREVTPESLPAVSWRTLGRGAVSQVCKVIGSGVDGTVTWGTAEAGSPTGDPSARSSPAPASRVTP